MKQATLASNSKINRFALKWFEVFNDPDNINFYDIFDTTKPFANECWALGLVMDCGEALQKEVPDLYPLRDLEHLNACIDQIDDIQALGNGIFSQWRYFNHWHTDGITPQDYKWFAVAFARLAYLTADR